MTTTETTDRWAVWTRQQERLGVVRIVNGTVRPDAPALTFMTGWARKRFVEYAKKRQWRLEDV